MGKSFFGLPGLISRACLNQLQVKLIKYYFVYKFWTQTDGQSLPWSRILLKISVVNIFSLTICSTWTVVNIDKTVICVCDHCAPAAAPTMSQCPLSNSALITMLYCKVINSRTSLFAHLLNICSHILHTLTYSMHSSPHTLKKVENILVKSKMQARDLSITYQGRKLARVGCCLVRNVLSLMLSVKNKSLGPEMEDS